jgi:AraC-like DNA-binding protein
MLLRVLADTVLQYDVAPAALFQGRAERYLDCEPFRLRVPLSEYRALLTRAVALTGDPAIGLRCGLRASEAAFDLMTPLMGHVPTLRHAIREARQFQGLAFRGVYLHLSEEAGVARLRWEFPHGHEATDRSLAEFLTAGLLRLLRGFGGARDDLYGAHFEHSRPAYHQAYSAAFEGAERFWKEFTGLEFKAHLLDRGNIHANPALQSLVHTQAEQYLDQIARPSRLVERLRMYLLNQQAARVPDMTDAARDLGVSVRTMRRRLDEDAVSYRALTQEMCRERACAMLRDPEFTLQGVADALGFADVASFHRAFKRWTGMTASAYRDAR